jgi:homoserine dehydrogenase
VNSVRIGLLGGGTVGSAFVELAAAQEATIQQRTGLQVSVTRVAVRDLAKPRPALANVAVTNDPFSVVDADDVDLIIEVMGGVEPARELILRAFQKGKPVVTANKELIAKHGAELFAAADAAGVDFLFEAAVAGGIPLIRPLRESLLAEPVDRVMGIVNGTTNYILTRMDESGAQYSDAFAEAKSLGYVEADPSADIDGHDAAAKIAIIAAIAFGASVTSADVSCEGIAQISADDISFAHRHGYVIKLLATAERFHTPDSLSVRVHPCLIPKTHPLGSVRESFNAVVVEGDAVGELMFYGRGAGGSPTASAVLGDAVDAAVNLSRGAHASIGGFVRLPIRPLPDLVNAFFLSLLVEDRPGVLAAIANVFGERGVSIASMEQDGGGDGVARLDFITHPAQESAVAQTLDALRSVDTVRTIGSVIRVLSDGVVVE